MTMKILGFALALLAAGLVAGTVAVQSAYASRQASGGLLFHYGLVPAEVVLAHPQSHAEREMHSGRAGARATSFWRFSTPMIRRVSHRRT